MRILVTGFGPFDGFEANPSEQLARDSGLPHRILPVSFQAVDEFLDELAADPPDMLLMLGVAGESERMRLECVARNFVGSYPDVDGRVFGPGPIDPTGPAALSGTLWKPELESMSHDFESSVDAGDYLCNYIYFRALQALPMTRVGFLHVPPYHGITLDSQASAIMGVVGRLQDALRFRV